MPTIYAISKPQHKIFIETALALTKGGRDYWANSPESVVMRDHWDVSMGGCLVFWKLSLITPHSIFFTHHLSLITHHLSLKLPQFPKPHPFGTYFQLLITQCFLLFVGPIPKHLVKYFLMFMLFSASYFLFLFFFFSFNPPIPKLTEPKLLSSTIHCLPLHPFTEPSTQLKKTITVQTIKHQTNPP